jgi:cytochrome c biogenesis protein
VIRAIKRFFLSRKIILSLILLILAAIFIAYLFPQRFSTSSLEMEKWQQTYPAWVLWVERLGLNHVYSTLWFAVLLLVFLISLIISTLEQIKNSIKKTFGNVVISGGKSIRVNTTEEKLKIAIKKLGYLQTVKNREFLRFVKHPWGYWGNVLLHLGIVLVIASSLIIVLTEKRGRLQLIEGELYVPGTPWVMEEKGMLVGSYILPEAVRLDNVFPEFWETDDLKQLTTVISFSDSQGNTKRYKLAINQTVNYQGIRVYQDQRFGHAFFVNLTDKTGTRNGLILQIQNPVKRDKAGYGNFRFGRIPYLLKAKYFVDAEKKNMLSLSPLLVMRLVDRGRVIGEVSLKNGKSGQLGPYTATLVDVSMWAGMIFVDITGMTGIFIGFFIIILGGGLTYFMPPREFYIKKEESGLFIISWKATRFESFYRDEYEKIAACFEREK